MQVKEESNSCEQRLCMGQVTALLGSSQVASSIKSWYTVVRERRKEAGLLHHLLGLIFIASDILLLDYDTKKERKGSLVMANDRKQSIDQD
jgi:hypothetical protein